MNTSYLTSFDILQALYKSVPTNIYPMWWKNDGTYEIVVSSILTQNTKYKNVEKSLIKLSENNITTMDDFSTIDTKNLALLIKSSGFYNTKAKYIKKLSLNIKKEFNTFSNFQENVSREWLLLQKGIGQESADSILCYACYKDEMVADAYSHKLLYSLGIELESYEEVKLFLSKDLNLHLDKISSLYKKELSLNQVFALFHGLIVDYCKIHIDKKVIDLTLFKENIS
jgi:endonuclease-3 related protein